MIRQIPLEIKRWKKIKEDKIEHPLGYIINDSQTWIISQHFPGFIPLTNFMKNNYLRLSDKDKLKIALSISNIMANLFRLDSSLSHGHLSPQNIMV